MIFLSAEFTCSKYIPEERREAEIQLAVRSSQLANKQPIHQTNYTMKPLSYS